MLGNLLAYVFVIAIIIIIIIIKASCIAVNSKSTTNALKYSKCYVLSLFVA